MGSSGCARAREPWAVLAAILFVLVATFPPVQMVKLLRYRHNPLGFQFIFMCLVLLTISLKCSFLFSITCEGSRMRYEAIFFTFMFPLELQLLTYSMLCYFFQYVLNKSSWHRLWWKWATLWGVFNVVTLSFLFGLYGRCHDDTCFDQPAWFALYGYVYLMLCLILAPLGVRVANRLRNGHALAPELQCRSATTVTIITVTVVAVFLTRSMYDIMVSLGYVSWSVKKVASRDGFKQFIFFVLFDLVPAMCILIMFRNIPKSPPKQLVRSRKVSVNEAKSILNQHTDLFHDPKRYDSCDEMDDVRTNGIGIPGM